MSNQASNLGASVEQCRGGYHSVHFRILPAPDSPSEAKHPARRYQSSHPCSCGSVLSLVTDGRGALARCQGALSSSHYRRVFSDDTSSSYKPLIRGIYWAEKCQLTTPKRPITSEKMLTLQASTTIYGLGLRTAK